MSKNMLLLMRHAKSDWSHSSLTDKERPLNARGLAAAPRMAEWLLANQSMPDIILCSSAKRTQETFQGMKQYWSDLLPATKVTLPEFVTVDQLYLAPANLILSIASQYTRHASIMVLAHNPGMEDLASYLSRRHVEMPTGAIAIFEAHETGWPVHWLEANSWKWREIVKPRDLGKDLD